MYNTKAPRAPADLPEFIQRIVLVFEEEAQRKRIDLQLFYQFSQPFYWFDPDKVEKILSNLLSNALKFTAENGSITINVQAEPLDAAATTFGTTDLIKLTVHNTGSGIPDEKLPRVFDRFYQVDPLLEGTTTGSGIGLALVKELVEMMQGTVTVESLPTLGTTFIIKLPCRQARPEVVSDNRPDNPMLPTLPTDQALTSVQTLDEKSGQILVVEDNDDLAELIVSALVNEGRVKRVNNGRLGVSTAISDVPDLIISDVLMPGLDGYELCRQLKANPVTNHIPIVLLTAKVALESQLEGLSAGADDYITKPFQIDELRGRVRNRLAQQMRARQHFRTQLLGEGNLPIASPAPQDEFMNRVYKILTDRLDDSSFGVEPLANVIGISRMHLNRKIKAMTGLTPNEFIRIVRLKRAAELLVTGVSVSEVADRVGFDTPAYFSKVFKDQYHVTPSEYVEQKRHEVA